MGMLGAPFRVSPFSFLRLDSCREQATKKTPNEEFCRESSLGSLLVWKIRIPRRLLRLHQVVAYSGQSWCSQECAVIFVQLGNEKRFFVMAIT
jgi:hypothetical protein